jgi:hypothetical protein
MTMADRYFVPICLYPHTKYRTREGVAALFEKYELHRRDHLIVIADRLLGFDNLVTGRYWSSDTVFEKARREAEQIFKMIKRISVAAGAHESGRIAYWDEIAETPRFQEFAGRMRREFLAEKMLRSALEEFVERRVGRFGLGSRPDEERDYEREFLLSEVCMSVFCTEVLGNRVEIWESAPAPDIPDPLKLLYNKRPEVVTRVTGRPPARALRFLFDMATAA